jgi:acylphosphatase
MIILSNNNPQDTLSNDENVPVNNYLSNIRAHLIISGKVQGVYFRKYTQEISIKNKVRGWVRNLKNGNVECILEGLPLNVEKVIERCHIGPKNSRVDKIDINYETYTGEFQGFKIDG